MSVLKKLTNKSSIIKKSIAFVRKGPRAALRWRSGPEDYLSYPPLLANSFPKSGTHLLLQILEVIPNSRFFESFIASMPPVRFKERSPEAHLSRIRAVAPGEVVPTHIFFDERYAEAMKRLNCAHFFIYRDLRDVVVSEAHYLARMARWHRLHPIFARMASDEERIAFSIRGAEDPNFGYDYPNIAERFRRYQGWLGRDDVFPIKFETLVSPDRDATLLRMLAFYNERAAQPVDSQATMQAIIANLDPKMSRTFRKGKAGGWRHAFTPAHAEMMKELAGDLLIELGYETDHNWSCDTDNEEAIFVEKRNIA